MTIRGLAEAAGVTAPTIRYYEEIGLLPPAERSRSGQRLYGPADVERLVMIRRCRAFGFSVARTADLMRVFASSHTDCAEARDLAADRLAEVRAKLTELAGFAKTLEGLVAQCDATCRGGGGCHCVVYKAMQRPGAGGIPNLRD